MDKTTRRQKREERQRRKAERRAKKQARTPGVLLKEFWNLPNMLTLGRILIIPLFVWFTYDADPAYSLAAAALFAIAAVTDVVDGFLARRWNLVTVVGKFMDPLADKLIVMAALVMMTRLGRVPAWIVIVLLSRELIVSGLRMVAASEGMVIAAGQEGKWKTSVQLVGMVALCVHYVHPVDFLFVTYDVDFNFAGKAMIYFSTLLSVWSAANYFRAFLGMLSSREAKAAPGRT